MKTVSTHAAKTHLSRLLDEVQSGQVYIITRNGKPVAELRSRPQTTRTTPHPVFSKVKILYDPIQDLGTDEWGEIE